ncbi:MAG TPA: TMEM175 family protein [Candidatus Binataceae bacterium]|jgi:uncharacterized membrane protein|nr:TMEM175 family protein [Candidatus Binataceae bacterium]
METGRLEAFTDGVFAIVITIMVLEIKAPHRSDFAALMACMPIFAAYALSYVNVGIFWNNHHHMLHATDRVDGKVLWANLFLLFWISLMPFAIRWMDDAHFTALPTAAYGVTLAMAALAYILLEWSIVACNGSTSALARAVGGDRKGKISLVIYVISIALSFISPSIAITLYVAVALMWFLPDRRIESVLMK